MSQNHGHLRSTDGHLQHSAYSTRTSDYASGFDQQNSYGSNGGYPAPVPAHGGVASMGIGQPRVALPPNVKFPPSMSQSRHQIAMPNAHVPTYPPPQAMAVHPPPPTGGAAVFVQAPPVATPVSTEYGAADVIRQLDVAADENNRLRIRLQENNRILEEKVQEIQHCLDSRERDRQDLEARINHLEGKLRDEEARRERAEERTKQEENQRKSMPAQTVENQAVPAGKDETTNKLFEAQVAVMGFKCRVMQLKGELDDLRKEGGIDASTKEEMERLRTENATLHDDIMRYKKDRDAAAKRLPSPQQVSSGTSQHDQARALKIKELSDLCRSQELVIKEVNQQLNDKRALFASETQRMHQQSQQLQTEVQQLQAELRRVQNQLASHQQNSEQRLTSLMTQLNQSRQEQSRVQELGRQLSVSHAEISTLNRDLEQTKKDVDKYRKRSEVFETRAKESTTKLTSMQDQMKSGGDQQPVPKPRPDISLLKNERERMETQLATVQSNYDREKRAREGLETELQTERRKTQELLMKNNQLQSQLGTISGAERGPRERDRNREMELERMQLELDRLTREKTQNETEIADLKKARKEALDGKIEFEAQVARLNEEITTLKSDSPAQKGKPKKSMEVRLNDYAGKLATLENLFKQEKTEKAKLQSQLDQEKQRTHELEERTLLLVREKSHLEEETVRNLQQQKSEVEHHLHQKEMELVSANTRHQADLDKLRGETASQKQNYERKIEEKQATLHQKEKEIENMQQSNRVERQGEVEALRQELQRAQTQIQQKGNEVDQILGELDTHRTTVHVLQTDKETLQANESKVTHRLRETLHECDLLKNELTNTQKVTGEFRKECESLVADYQGAAKKIELLEEERDRYRNQAQMGMRELAQRGERVKTLEAERKSLQEQLQHMDMQLKQYMADFRNEREMRENAMQVKKMAERKQHDLSGEVTTLQKQLTELQTVKHIDSDVVSQIEGQPSVAGGGDRWSGGMAGHTVTPNTRPANERPLYTHPNEPTGGSPHAPPLPPKPGLPGPSGGTEYPQPRPAIQPQQYVGPGVAHMLPSATGPIHQRQELVTAGPHFSQVQPSVSQAQGGRVVPVPANVPAMDVHTRPVGYTPHSRAEAMQHVDQRMRTVPHMDPSNMRAGGGHNIPPMDPLNMTAGGGHHMDHHTIRPGGGQPGVAMRQIPVSSSPGPPQPMRVPEGGGGGGVWIAPGDIVNPNRPEEACPLCGRNDFQTVTDLEIHCARCTGPT